MTRGFASDIILHSEGTNSTEKAANFEIPSDAFEKAMAARADYNGQFFVIYYKNKGLFPSQLNTTLVSVL